jgi:hypothetical protein
MARSKQAPDVPRFERHRVDNLYSIAHLFPRAHRCGVYILQFGNGERYVGQAMNVVARFAAHKRRWPDIVTLDFSSCAKDTLNEFERRIITGQRSAGFQLRNITYAAGPLGGSDLDPIVTPVEQQAWLNDPHWQLDDAPRMDDEAQRLKTRPKFRQFVKHFGFGPAALAINLYVTATIPKPQETERTFWSLSAMPSTNKRRIGGRLATLSINKMETLFLYGGEMPDIGPGFGGCINVSRESLTKEWGSLDEMRRNHEELEFDVPGYEAAGGDALAIRFLGADFMSLLVDAPAVVEAARKLNLMLMRKGPTFQWRWHCYDLADLALMDLDDLVPYLESLS